MLYFFEGLFSLLRRDVELGLRLSSLLFLLLLLFRLCGGSNDSRNSSVNDFSHFV